MKKLFALLLTLAMVLSMAACCAKEENPAETPAEKPAEAPTEEAIEITFPTMWVGTSTMTQWWADRIAAFNAEYAGKINVKVEEIAGDQNYVDKMKVLYSSNSLPDAFAAGGYNLIDSMQDQLVDLTPYMDDELKSLASDLCWEVNSRDGKIYGVPQARQVIGYFYNKDLFAQAGIESVPTTWAEFVDVCAKLKAAGITPLTTDDAYTPQQFGIHLARLIGTDATKAVVNDGLWAETPEVLATAQAIESLAKAGYYSDLVASNAFPTGQNTEFATGMVAMYVNGSWLPNEIRNITGDTFNWGFFNYPEVDGGINGTEAMVIGCQSFAITNKCQNTEAAFALIEKITRGTWDASCPDPRS